MLGLRADGRTAFGCDSIGIRIFFRLILQRICLEVFLFFFERERNQDKSVDQQCTKNFYYYRTKVKRERSCIGLPMKTRIKLFFFCCLKKSWLKSRVMRTKKGRKESCQQNLQSLMESRGTAFAVTKVSSEKTRLGLYPGDHQQSCPSNQRDS